MVRDKKRKRHTDLPNNWRERERVTGENVMQSQPPKDIQIRPCQINILLHWDGSSTSPKIQHGQETLCDVDAVVVRYKGKAFFFRLFNPYSGGLYSRGHTPQGDPHPNHSTPQHQQVPHLLLSSFSSGFFLGGGAKPFNWNLSMFQKYFFYIYVQGVD